MRSQLKFKKIDTAEMIQQYKKLTRRYVNVDFPEAYLRRSHITAIVYLRTQDSKPIILGGFLFVHRTPFRVLEQIPEDLIQENIFLQNRLHRTFEITGVWIHPLLKAGNLRCRFWIQLLQALLCEYLKGRYYFVYSYDATKKRLGHVYDVWSPLRIFEGPVYISGMKEETREIVEFACIRSCFVALLWNPLFLVRRLFRNFWVIR